MVCLLIQECCNFLCRHALSSPFGVYSLHWLFSSYYKPLVVLGAQDMCGLDPPAKHATCVQMSELMDDRSEQTPLWKSIAELDEP